MQRGNRGERREEEGWGGDGEDWEVRGEERER